MPATIENLDSLLRGYAIEPVPFWVREGGMFAERLISGTPIFADTRRTLPYHAGHGSARPFTGSNAFLDFRTIGVLETNSLEIDSAEYYTARTAIQLLRVGVEPHLQGKGYGLALVETLACIAQERNIKLLVCSGNSDAFPHLRDFSQLGFVRKPLFLRPDKCAYARSPSSEACYFPLYAPLPLEIPPAP